MRSSFRFSSLVVVGLVIGMVVVGVGLAQLTIPTTLTNATIYIKDLLVTSDGTSSTNPQITLNGANGILAIKSLVNTPVLGTNANGEVIVQTSQAVYNYIANQVSGAITTAISGALNTGNSNNGTGGNGSGDNGRYYNPKGEAPTNTGVTDIYFADPAISGPDAVVRIGMQDPANNGNTANYTNSNLDSSQLIVKGDIESRSALKIRSNLNQTNKDKVPIGNSIFATYILQGSGTFNNALIIDSHYFSPPNNIGSYVVMKNDSVNTKVGINTLTLPTATLDIANTLSTNGTTLVSLDSKVGSAGSNASAASISHTRTNNAYDASLNLGTVNSSFVATQKVKIASSGDSYINGGDLGIGLTNPQVALHVSGDVRANAYYYNSDRTLKTNIRVIDNALDMVRQLHGYTFTWKADGKKAIGLIAQEVEKIFPDLVNTDAQGIKSVQYGNLVAPLIEAVRTLADRVDALFAKYLDQQKRIDDLEARIARLEALADIH